MGQPTLVTAPDVDGPFEVDVFRTAFSRNVENLAAAVSLQFMHDNFARPHISLANPTHGPRAPNSHCPAIQREALTGAGAD